VSKYSINIHTWFQQRELNYCPPHFVKTTTPVQEDSIIWIKQNLTGRFCLIPPLDGEYKIGEMSPAFEDPKEAILYTLTWS